MTENAGQSFSQGPGWWQASDAKWYPPEMRPATAPILPAPAPSGPKGSAWQRFRANPLWLQVVAWAAVSFIALAAIGAAIGSDNKPRKTAAVAPSSTVQSSSNSSSKASTTSSTTTTTAATTTTTTAPTTTAPPPPPPPPTTAPPAKVPPTTQGPFADETVSKTNARQKAADYLDYTSFSRKGLIGQLGYEGFTQDDAAYGVDALNVDWNEQAAKKAAEYLNYTSFSHSGLVDQLVYEGFTQAQAEYGVSTTGL